MIGKITDESKLFTYLKENVIFDLEQSEDQYSFYDCYSLEFNWDVELKCRKTHYDDLIIEKSKYDKLLFRSIYHNTEPIYINSTPRGIYLFKLVDIPMPQWEDRMMPKTSEFSQRHFISKTVGYLNISDSERLL